MGELVLSFEDNETSLCFGLEDFSIKSVSESCLRFDMIIFLKTEL